MRQKLEVKKIDKTAMDKKGFASDQQVRWCPGCGDYAILASVQKVLPKLGIPKENYAFISGIGCASRFPYYMDTYGFHTIHGRAPTIATGLKLMRPDLSVWVITGDGDGFSIGTNHLLHLMRRNVDVTILLFNNRIYGLTKGQYSPTSEEGKVTKSSPFGAVDEPLSPIALSLAANCSFVARAIDVDSVRLQEIIELAARHKGTSFVEIYQNCNVFNDGAFANIADRGVREERTVSIMPLKPIIFGKEKLKTIEIKDSKVCIKEIKDHSEATIYDPEQNPSLAQAISAMKLPVAIGVLQQIDRPRYEESLAKKVSAAKNKNTHSSVQALLSKGASWHNG